MLWSFCRPRPRVLITRATTAKDGDGDDRRHCVSLFLFRLSLSRARAHRVGGSEKPSRRPIFEKMRETKAPKTRRGSTSASLSLKKRHSRARSHHRFFSSPSFDADIRKIQNKSGEPETVENTRWRIMIRCDTFFPRRKRRSAIQNLCTFFSFIVDSISNA